MQWITLWIPLDRWYRMPLGMSNMQRLIKVSLTSAASVILAGIRTATVTCVGVSTIAAAIERVTG